MSINHESQHCYRNDTPRHESCGSDRKGGGGTNPFTAPYRRKRYDENGVNKKQKKSLKSFLRSRQISRHENRRSSSDREGLRRRVGTDKVWMYMFMGFFHLTAQ